MITRAKIDCLILEPEFGMRMLLDDILSVSKDRSITTYLCETEKNAIQEVKNNNQLNVIICPNPSLGDKDNFISKVREFDTKIPILCLSHVNTLPERSFAFDQGATDYLERPIAPTELIDKINWWILRGHRKI